MSDQGIGEILRRLAALEEWARQPRAESAIEGTFTPTYFGQTTPGLTTYAAQVGAYTRIDNRVDFTLYLNWSAVTGTGNALVGGLPFTSRNTANLLAAHRIWYAGITFLSGNTIQCVQRPNTTQIELWYAPASNAAAGQIAIEAAGEIVISGTYFL